MTAGAHFRIDQASNPVPTGTTDVARTDLRQGSVVVLVGDNSSGQNNPVWTIVSFPPGSAQAQPNNPNTFMANFTPDVPGSYLLTFQVNGGGVGNVKQFICAATFTSTGLVIDDGLREPAPGETSGDDNSAGNQRSWASAYEAGMARYMPIVANVTALRNRVANRQKHVELLGYTAAGDQGGGIFYWDASSVLADDGGTVFQPTGFATGRWRRQFAGGVYVTWFGADMTGVLDSTSAFVNAMSASRDVGIPEGSFKVTGIVPPANTTLRWLTRRSQVIGTGIARPDGAKVVIDVVNNDVVLIGRAGQKILPTLWDTDASFRASVKVSGSATAGSSGTPNYAVRCGFLNGSSTGQRIEGLTIDANHVGFWESLKCGPDAAGGNAFCHLERLYLIRGWKNLRITGSWTQSRVFSIFTDARASGGSLAAGTQNHSGIVVESAGLGTFQETTFADLNISNYAQYGLDLQDGGVDFTIVRCTAQSEALDPMDVDYPGSPCSQVRAAYRILKGNSATIINPHIEAPTPQYSDTFTMVAGTGVITSTSTLTLVNDDEVTLTTTGTLPSTLVNGRAYFVRDVSGNTFKVSQLRGGAAISGGGAGSGTHTFTRDVIGIQIGGDGAGEFPTNLTIKGGESTAYNVPIQLNQFDHLTLESIFTFSTVAGGTMVRNRSNIVGGRARGGRIVAPAGGLGNAVDIDDLTGIELVYKDNLDAGGTGHPTMQYAGRQKNTVLEGSTTIGASLTITAVSNTTPQKLTIGGHGLETGQHVYVTGSSVVAEAEYTLTFVDANTVSLNGTTAAGAEGAVGAVVTIRSDTNVGYGVLTWKGAVGANTTGHIPAGQTFALIAYPDADAGHTNRLTGGTIFEGTYWDGAAVQGFNTTWFPFIDPSTGIGGWRAVLTGSPSGVPFEVYNDDHLAWGNRKIMTGTGSPQTNVAAPVGSIYFDLTGGTAAIMYVKASGTGTTGWDLVTSANAP
jgi:hypothetical protein